MELDHQEQFWISRISIATVFFTGFSGLVYEVIWQRYLANLLGSEAKSTCVILAVFLGGLAIGYRLFGKLSSSKSPSSVVKLCGMCEIGIGIWAFAFPQIYSLVWNAIGVVNPESPFSTTYEILLAIALIGVPTILMGCTLPLLTQGLSFSTKRVPKVHALIYAWNTGGAFLGCLIAGFVLLPKFGLPITIMTTALINIVAGVILAGLGAELSDEASPIAKTTVQKTNIFAIATAFIAGFVGITFQILLMRIAGLSLGSSDYTFSMIVAIYILMLALGAASLQRSKDSSQGKLLVLNQILLICGLCAFYFVVPYIPYLILLIRTSFSSVIVAFYFYYLTAGLAFGLILLIPLTSIGRGMPLLLGYLRPNISSAGGDVGTLYFWNAVGCVAGALIGGYGFLTFMNLDSLLKVAIGLAGISLVLILLLTRVKSNTRYGFTGAIAALIVVSIFVPKWDDYLLGLGLFRSPTAFPALYNGPRAAMKTLFDTIRIIARRDDPNTSVSIGEDNNVSVNGASYSRSIVVNGKSDGGTVGVDMATTRLLAHLPMMLSRGDNSKVAVVGFGTGTTSGELALYPEIKEVNCIEISSAVRQFSDQFSFINHNVTENPKFRWHNTDAYRFLASNSEKYRVIVSEPSNPWVGGVERLYSKEFYDRVRGSLDQQGVFAQWFHAYSVSDETLAMVLNTFSSSFRYTRIFSLHDVDLIILGTQSPINESNLEAFKTHWNTASPDIKKDLKEISMITPEQILSLEIPIPGAAFASAETHTLEFPKLSFAAGKDFFEGSHTNLQTVLDNEGFRPWVGRSRAVALVGLWLKNENSNSSKEESLMSIAQTLCDLKDPAFLPNWKNAPYGCKASLLALGAMGRIPLGSSVDPHLIDQLQQFMGIKSVKALHSNDDQKLQVVEAKKSLKIYEQFNSAVSLFPLNTLLDTSAPCFHSEEKEALQCRTQLIDVLIDNGFLDEAKKEFSALKSLPSAATIIPPQALKKVIERLAVGDQALKTVQ